MESAPLILLRYWLAPVIVVATLLLSLWLSGLPFSAPYAVLAVTAFFVSRHIMSPLELARVPRSAWSPGRLLRQLAEWSGTALIVLALAVALKAFGAGSMRVVAAWVCATPIALLLGATLSQNMARRFPVALLGSRRFIIIGLNDLGLELARRVEHSGSPDRFLGYFDFRSDPRLATIGAAELTGSGAEAVDFVRSHNVQAVYIALPLSKEQRIVDLLDGLRDTAASVYFVPDLFAFDLLQPHIVDIGGIPAYSVCDTPLQGMCEVRKRAVDVLLGLTGLVLLSPAMLLIAAAVKLSSPGPALFRQRRYGLNGEEFTVYKFRSMTASRDSGAVIQATRHDARVTAVGRFLRRTSLDEVPQLFNVLQGHMSLVGPRPHAVAHNEQYRRLIGGYMIRHKVRPGITGWAQVNGLRGETETVDKMRRRVEHDIEYLRNWSLWLDVKIIFKTFLAVVSDKGAY